MTSGRRKQKGIIENGKRVYGGNGEGYKKSLDSEMTVLLYGNTFSPRRVTSICGTNLMVDFKLKPRTDFEARNSLPVRWEFRWRKGFN